MTFRPSTPLLSSAPALALLALAFLVESLAAALFRDLDLVELALVVVPSNLVLHHFARDRRRPLLLGQAR